MRPFRRRRKVETQPPVPPAPDLSKSFSGTAEFNASLAEFGQWPWLGYATMYERQPAVRSVIDFLARNVAQLNLKLYERATNTDRVELDDHPLVVLIRNPNPRMTRYRLLRDTVASIGIYDRAYWRKIRRDGQIVALLHIPPVHVRFEEVRRNGQGPIYMYRIGDEPVARDDLVVFPGYHPGGGELGLSPLETLRRVLAEDWSAVQHRRYFWENAARQSGTIERPLEAPEWSDTARKRFRTDWDATMTGDRASGRTAILEEGMHWNPASWSPKESLYIEGRELTYREVAMAYFGPVTGRQWLEQTGSGTKENHRQLYQDVFGPWLSMLQDEIELQLLADLNPGGDRLYVEFNLADKLKGSFEEQAKTLVSSTGVPFTAVNESRGRMNLPRIDDPAFDVPVQPLNVLYGGQPAVTMPTADPGSPPAAELPPATQLERAAGALPAAAKAAPAPAVRRRDEAAKAQTDVIRRFMTRQSRTVISLLGARKSAKASPAGVWDAARWDAELADELLHAAIPLTTATGERAARQIRGSYDTPTTVPFLTENARVAAERINQGTYESLQIELAEAEDPVAAARGVFDQSAGGRAELLGLGRATTLINWSRNEAARQSSAADGRLRTKTWVVTSAKSRHPEWNGDTVPVWTTFSNGAQYPGDWSLGAEHVAGCHCLMELGS